jgi:hypothetical protein
MAESICSCVSELTLEKLIFARSLHLLTASNNSKVELILKPLEFGPLMTVCFG